MSEVQVCKCVYVLLCLLCLCCVVCAVCLCCVWYGVYGMSVSVVVSGFVVYCLVLCAMKEEKRNLGEKGQKEKLKDKLINLARKHSQRSKESSSFSKKLAATILDNIQARVFVLRIQKFPHLLLMTLF